MSRAASAGSKGRLARAQELLREFYVAPYRHTFAKAQQEEDDFLMLVMLSDSLGLPLADRYYTLELLPLLHEEVHAWHRRMDMPHSPFDQISCC